MTLAQNEVYNRLLEGSKKLVEILNTFPELRTLPGYQDVETSLAELGVIPPPKSEEEDDGDLVEFDMKNELGPFLWVGVFEILDPATQEVVQQPLTYTSPNGDFIPSYTQELENIPYLIKVCQTIQSMTGYKWKLLEYRARKEWNPILFAAAQNTELAH